MAEIANAQNTSVAQIAIAYEIANTSVSHFRGVYNTPEEYARAFTGIFQAVYSALVNGEDFTKEDWDKVTKRLAE